VPNRPVLLNHRPHPYQMCETIRTVRNMIDQMSTVGADQDVFPRGQHGPDEAALEQRVAGRFFDFSLTHTARSEGAVILAQSRSGGMGFGFVLGRSFGCVLGRGAAEAVAFAAFWKAPG
jgi:hypothetical protein